jgi:hypothetical protein
MARGYANATGRFIVKYDEEGPNVPGTFDYSATLVWGPFVIALWPLWVILYLED